MMEETNSLKRLAVAGLSYSPTGGGVYAILLQEVGGEKRIPIVIGALEAQSIECKLQEITPPRPLTHDLIASMLTATGFRLTYIEIKRLPSGVYAADMHLERGDENIVLDSRSSDAIAVALRMGAPIFCTSALLDEVGVERRSAATAGRAQRTEARLKKIYSAIDDAGRDLSGKSREELEAMLAQAVEEERYEDAARIKQELASRK